MAEPNTDVKGPTSSGFIPKPPVPQSVGAKAPSAPVPQSVGAKSAAPAPQRRTFTEEFKQDAVARVIDGGETLQAVADDIGVHVNVLRGWRQKDTSEPVSQVGTETIEDLRVQVALLRAEIEYMKKRESILRR